MLVGGLQDIDVRDAASAAITSADAQLHINLWGQVARIVDGVSALPILGLLGMAAWIGGQGASANLVLDRAATTESYDDYTLFDLLHSVLEAGVDLCQWDSMRVAMSTGSAT